MRSTPRSSLPDPHGTRTIPFTTLHRKPGDTPDKETSLLPGEMIASFLIPAAPWARRSLYLKVRDRQSYEFALASAAVALDQVDGAVRNARIALGGSPPRRGEPSRPKRSFAANRLTSKTPWPRRTPHLPPPRAMATTTFKIALGKRTLSRALQQAAALEI